MDMKAGMDLANQKKLEEDGKQEEESNIKNKKLGGIKTMPFILGEFALILFFSVFFISPAQLELPKPAFHSCSNGLYYRRN